MKPAPALEDALAAVERSGSLGEKQIAHMLRHHGIRFSYEHPMTVVDRGKVRVWYGDFYLPDYGIVLEHAGRMDDPDYRNGIAHKQDVYEACGIPCVFVDAQTLRGYWPKRILEAIRGRLRERLARFEACVAPTGHAKE